LDSQKADGELSLGQFCAPAGPFRRQHNDIAAAIFSIIGVTYAVLLAFVAMLAWEGFNKAKAVSYSEAALVLDVSQAADGLAEPTKANLIDALNRYTKAVVAIEWPAQAEGHVARAGDRYLDDMQRLAASIRPSSHGDANLHVMLLRFFLGLAQNNDKAETGQSQLRSYGMSVYLAAKLFG
jgi:hypothetical protein